MIENTTLRDLLTKHLYRAEHDLKYKMLGWESTEKLRKLIEDTKAALATMVTPTEESHHPEPPGGCICGFMAQVTAPECPTCNPENVKHRIRPACGNQKDGNRICGENDFRCEPCEKEAFTMNAKEIKEKGFNPNHYPTEK